MDWNSQSNGRLHDSNSGNGGRRYRVDGCCGVRPDATKRPADHRRKPQLIVGIITELLIAGSEIAIALLVAVSLPVAESQN